MRTLLRHLIVISLICKHHFFRLLYVFYLILTFEFLLSNRLKEINKNAVQMENEQKHEILINFTGFGWYVLEYCSCVWPALMRYFEQGIYNRLLILFMVFLIGSFLHATDNLCIYWLVKLLIWISGLSLKSQIDKSKTLID